MLTYQFIGRYKYKNGRNTLDLSKDCVALIDKNEEFSVLNQETGYGIAVHFNCSKELQFDSTVFRLPIAIAESIRKLFMQIERDWYGRSDTYLLQCMSNLYTILHYLFMLRSTSYTPRNVITPIIQAEQYIRLQYADNSLNVRKLAQMCNLSEGYFRKLFKNTYLMPPSKYILNVRCEMAKALLTSGHYSVSQVADMTGFSDVYYFCRVFKTQTGQTPTAYRKTLRGVPPRPAAQQAIGPPP